MSLVPDPYRRQRSSDRNAAAPSLLRRGNERLVATIDDLHLPAGARLDDRTRVALNHHLRRLVTAVEIELRRHAARVLTSRNEVARAESMLIGGDEVMLRLTRAGLLRDQRLMDEVIARTRCDLITEALSPGPAAADEASLLIRLSELPDGIVAASARALLAAVARRRAANEEGSSSGSDLPAELHHQLVWWVAASVREAAIAAHGGNLSIDRAIIEAAQRSLAAHDEGTRVESAATRLAAAIDPRADEIGPLLVGALGDRQLALFIAILGRVVEVDFGGMRSIVIDPAGDRLWLALRAAGVERGILARIALKLSEADYRRDIEVFADKLDEIAAVPAETAMKALAPLMLHRDLRDAIDALSREAGR